MFKLIVFIHRQKRTTWLNTSYSLTRLHYDTVHRLLHVSLPVPFTVSFPFGVP
jgi:hypothetical protein